MTRLKTTALVCVALSVFVGLALPNENRQKPIPTSPWVADLGDGTYRNPIIYADYSDPDAIRVGEDFYMISSSFNCAPGIPILHSKDLVNWTIIAHVFQQQIPQDVFQKPQHGNGVWAPSLRYHNGEFFIFYGDPDFGIYMTKAKDGAGPWSTPLLVRSAKGWIDPCPFWDDDGNAYLVHAWANSRSGIKSILTINRLSPDGTKILDEGKMVFDGRVNHPTIEGPKLYKRNGYYYIFAPAGGVPTGWQTVLRSRNIYGPYEDRIVLEQGSTNVNGPHQGAWVELKSGESWFLHFQDRGAYGRIVHLQPMKWLDDWPVIGIDADGDGKGEPVMRRKKPDVGARHPIATPQTSDEFAKGELGLQWQWHANYLPEWASLAERAGWLRLRTVAQSESTNLWSTPNLLLQKLPAPEFTVTTRADFSNLPIGAKAGLLLMGTSYSYLSVERTNTGFLVSRVVCEGAEKGTGEVVESSQSVNGGSVMLRLRMRRDAATDFAFSTDGRRFVKLGRPFIAQPGKWIGAKVGLFSMTRPGREAGYADFDWLRLE